MKVLHNLYTYRELLKSNVKKEIRGKYKGSLLGVLWSFINPLLTVLVYAIVFPYLMRVQQDDYLIYLIIGIIPWNFFTTVINQGMISVRTNAGIIKKVYFPREILPISVALSGLINFLISCVIILLFTIFGGFGISWLLIFLPLIALIQTVLSLGLALALSAINIYIKDTEYIVAFILNMLFYGTPILYNLEMFKGAPAILVQLVKLNPMTQIIQMYRDIFLYFNVPSFTSITYVLVLSLVVLWLGMLIFRKLEKGFAEEI